MKQFLKDLENAELRIAAIRLIVAKTPELERWDSTPHLFQASLIQFFPSSRIGSSSDLNPLPSNSKECERSALRIARAFGGKWERRYDGSWDGRVEIAGGEPLLVCLHSVDAPKDSSTVDLTRLEEPISPQ